MTAINFILSPGAVVVLTDTLMTDDEGRPAAFVSKAYPIPHLLTIISGRGTSELIAGWAFDVACRTLAADFDVLVDLAPEALASRWAALDGKRTPTTTVYAFGWSPDEARVVGYAFRSGSDFEPERLEDGRRCAPGLSDPDRHMAALGEDGSIRGLLDVMTAAAEESRATPDDPERCHIGGEVVMNSIMLDDDNNVEMISQIIHHFDDRDEQYADALTRIV